MSISVTYAFTAGTTIDPAQVNQNFTDLGAAAPNKSGTEDITGVWRFSAASAVFDGNVEFNNPMYGSFGSAATPGYAFDGDPDTGVYRAAANTLGLVTGGVDYLQLGAGFLEFQAEISDPAAPAANKARLYIRDTGGKTELVARFPTGAIQQVAIEP